VSTFEEHLWQILAQNLEKRHKKIPKKPEACQNIPKCTSLDAIVPWPDQRREFHLAQFGATQVRVSSCCSNRLPHVTVTVTVSGHPETQSDRQSESQRT